MAVGWRFSLKVPGVYFGPWTAILKACQTAQASDREIRIKSHTGSSKRQPATHDIELQVAALRMKEINAVCVDGVECLDQAPRIVYPGSQRPWYTVDY